MKKLLLISFLGLFCLTSCVDEEEYPDARERLKTDVRKINDTMPVFKRVTKTKIRDDEFPKTTTMKIVRKNMNK